MSGVSPVPDDDLASLMDELAGVAGDLPAVSAAIEAVEEAPPPPPPVSADGATLFVFGQDSARPAERLTGLERMGEKLARTLRGVIEPFVRARVQVDCAALEIKRFDDWQAELPYFTSVSHYRLRPLKPGMLVTIEPGFIAGLIESFYGGTGTPRARKSAEFTPSEELLLERLLAKLTALVAEHWCEVTPIEATHAQRETTAGHLAFVRPEEMVVLQKFAVKPGLGAPTTLTLVYPLAMLRPIEEQMAARVHEGDCQSQNEWRQHLAEALQEVMLPVRSILARPEISVAQLLAMKPGDVIPITLAPRAPLLAGACMIGEGSIGEQEGHAALMIEKMGNR